MCDPKKFTFSFTKVARKQTLFAPKPKETVEYITCMEQNTLKLMHEEEAVQKELPVIPMPPGSSVRDRILHAIKTREEVKVDSKTNDPPKAEEPARKLTLEEMATKELMENVVLEENRPDLVIPSGIEEASRRQATLADYENMPIGDFGLAMLRGMGWAPQKGIGLKERVVAPADPIVRPKGMGLGADRSLAAHKSPVTTHAADLILRKGCHVKVISGPNEHFYGNVEGFQDLPGRILVRLALTNALVSLNEIMVQVVGAKEYQENSRVINLNKFQAAVQADDRLGDNRAVHSAVKAKRRHHSSRLASPESGRSKSQRSTDSDTSRGADQRRREKKMSSRRSDEDERLRSDKPERRRSYKHERRRSDEHERRRSDKHERRRHSEYK